MNQCIQCGVLYESDIKYSFFYAGRCNTCIAYRLNRKAASNNIFLTRGNGESFPEKTDISLKTRDITHGYRRNQTNPGGFW